jgi:hypothetical protein
MSDELLREAEQSPVNTRLSLPPNLNGPLTVVAAESLGDVAFAADFVGRTLADAGVSSKHRSHEGELRAEHEPTVWEQHKQKWEESFEERDREKRTLSFSPAHSTRGNCAKMRDLRSVEMNSIRVRVPHLRYWR